MTEDEEREQVRQRTEGNRRAIPETVLKLLAERNVPLDDVLKMNRQEFESLDHWIYEQNLDIEDRRFLIRFKHAGMTSLELSAYIERTDVERFELAEDDEEFHTMMEQLAEKDAEFAEAWKNWRSTRV